MKYRLSGLALVLCVLLTVTFVAGCSGEQPTSTSGSRATEQTTPTSDIQATEQPEPTSDSQPTEQATPTSGGKGQSTESDDIEYMVKLLAKGDVSEYWFLDLASISADPELTPLSQNLTDTWNGWNQDSSDQFGLTLQDAAFAVSLPGSAVFLGGIEDVEVLQETVAGLGYDQQETAGVVYWVNPDQDWESFTFLPNDVVMIMDRASDYFLEGLNGLIKYGLWDEDGDWQSYLDGLGGGWQDGVLLDIGSINDVVSQIHNSLMIHFDYNYDTQSMWAKAGTGTVRQTHRGGFDDDDSAKLAETEFREGLSETRAAVERAGTEEQGEETDEERYGREYLSACTDQEADRSGNELAVTQVCRADWFDFRYANYLLSVR